MCRSPLAFTVMSIRECRASRSSMWSKKPIPVATFEVPLPSRSTATSMSVSLVVRLTDALRLLAFISARPVLFAMTLRPRAIGMPSGSDLTPFYQALWGFATAAHPRLQWPKRALTSRSGGILRMQTQQSELWHGTTILTVRKGGVVAIGGDGQVSLGQTIIKSNAKKVRKLGKGDVIGGFAGATADAFTLFERLESKLEQYPGQLTRAAVELAKDWRTDRYLRRLEAMMIVADKDVSLVLTGTGDVLEPEAGVMAIGSGGNYALAAARALVDSDKDAETIVRRALDIAADICVYTNRNVTIETL